MKQYIFNIHDVVLLMTAAECLLLAVFQSILPTRARHDGRLLSAFLLIIAVASACTLILWNDQFSLAPWFEQTLLPYLLYSALLLKGPAIYLYVCSLTQRKLTLDRRLAIHLLPALLGLACIAVFGISSSDLRLATDTEQSLPTLAIEFIWDLASLVPFVYAAASLVQIRRYRIALKDEYSHYSEVELTWLSALAWGVFISWGWTMVVHVVAKFSSDIVADYMGIADNYLAFILINAFFAYSLTYAHQLLDTKPEEETHETVSEEAPSEPAITKVRHAMDVDKIYLKKNLNLEQFSERIDLPPKEVSGVINKHFGTNFFEFVNSYRVEAAKTLLADPEKADMTVLDVLLESGFNSKSAFHRFFSRLVGMSPTEYRKQALAAEASS
ncbi:MULTISPECIES: helix-turn-helix domain-containing protein [Microbulbifer]|uniref:Helix-turn-helix domain-containing protein n=1 Tax=Microbulbifer celer TaxID=435905 RepID=A0ABW3UCK5_9GAMM|nr:MULTISPECIES: AraC family transcriptional regulator [Microbulbifer]UFN56490.1 AraC family transcriptional regulator [Microbulbifer celer]